MRALICFALVACTGCATFTYERDTVFEPVNDDAVQALQVGKSDVGDTLAALGAPLYVWEGANESAVLAYGSKYDKGWGLRISRSIASFAYDSQIDRLEGWILVFDDDSKLKIMRKGMLRDLVGAARKPPAYVE